MESLNIEGPKSIESESQPVSFPNGEVKVKYYLENYPEDLEGGEKLKEFFQEFIKEEIENTNIFRSEKYGVELPYTSVSPVSIARKIYQRYAGSIPEFIKEDEEKKHSQKEFVFGTSPAIKEGNQFNVVEEAMHQCIKKLPQILKDLRAGKEPEDIEIFTMGMPTNVLGSLSEEFVEQMTAGPSDELAKVYSELIASKISSQSNLDSVELYGVSLGSSLAIRTGEALIDQGLVTQETEKDEKKSPHLQIKAEVPVALSPSEMKDFQIPIGFITDLFIESRLPELKAIEAGKPAFAKQVAGILEKRGIRENMTTLQKKLKQKAIFRIVKALGEGLESKPETKITALYGLKDATTYTLDMAKKAKERKEEFAGTLGESLLSRKDPNIRNFVADMPHMNLYFNKNEARRMEKLAKSLKNLKG